MRVVVDYLVNKWKDKIESIEVGGYHRTVQNIDVFPMSRYSSTEVDTYGEVWKVNFNFSNALSSGEEVEDIPTSLLRARYNDKIIKLFIDLFKINSIISSEQHKGFSVQGLSGEILPDNKEYVNYIDYQGHRLIIEFHPQSFLSEYRNSQIDRLLDK